MTKPCKLPSAPATSLTIPLTSPDMRIAGNSAIAERAFCQYAKSSVFPSTDFKADLINTAWIATMAAEKTPRTMPKNGASRPTVRFVPVFAATAAVDKNGAGMNA